jgi:sn-glycerol 3-phosphate transport system substrate-binding protein
MKKLALITICLFLTFGLFAGAEQEAAAPEGPIEIVWWHAHGGRLGELVDEIAAGFNESQSDYVVKPIMQGNYEETMTSGIAAFRAGDQPHILQVFEVGTATMMSAKGAIVPVHQLMADAGIDFDPAKYLAAVTGYYSSADKKIIGMPFNSSTPVLYYNKDAFRAAGLDPDKPPRTWSEVEEAAKALIASGASNAGFSTAWPSWIHMENLGAYHDVPMGTLTNGFGGLGTEFLFNGPLQVAHIQQLADWQNEKIFVFGGRTNTGNALFSSGEVGMYTESSAGYAGFKTTCEFEFGVSYLPYWEDQPGAPQNTIIGGAALYPMAGHSEAEYKGVAAFFSYLYTPEVQAWWHQQTGYLPITEAAYDLSISQGFYEKNPGTDIAIKQMLLNPPTGNSMGIRFGNFVQIRNLIEDEMEAVFGGAKTAQKALDDAVASGNALLRRFEDTNK